jgi:hypothetical protein
MRLMKPELSDRCEVNGKELRPGLGVDVSSRMERIEIPLARAIERIGPSVIYEAYYRVQDGNGCWHRTSRRVEPGSTIKLYSYDRTKTYVVEV